MNVDVIQIGSHVGKGDRVFAEFERGHFQSGILLEPIPELFHELRANYTKAGDGLRFVNAALHPTRKQAELEYVAEIQDLPLWSCAIGSMVPRVRDKHVAMIEEECGRTPTFKKIVVKCVTFEDLLREHQVQGVGELHIDAEGMDQEILASFPFDRFLPRKIVFEHAHLGPSEQQEALALLLGLGYRLHQEDLDYVAELG